jgi:hypothetical protein
MNKLGCLIGVFFTYGVCRGQNLVPNSSFESNTNCDTAVGWISPTLGTPDYLNVCNPGIHGVPSNYWGYENTQSGDAYMGIIIKNSGSGTIEWREYIQTPLINPLIVGTKYFLSIYLSLADDESQYGSDAIGALFSTTPISRSDHFHFTQAPQLLNQTGNFIINKNGWVQIAMSFIADSTYNYITIGNFFDDANTAYVPVSGGNLPRAYFYMDDICLSSDSALCISTVGINEVKNNDEVILFPNPFTDKINITAKRNELIEFVLYDLISRKIFNQSFTNSTSINTEQLTKGVYLYEVRNKNGVIKKGKVVKD